MLKRELIDTADIEDGERLELYSHGRDFMIVLGRNELMSTRMQYSEEQLAVLTLEQIDREAPQILIGGYGMGFTYRAARERLGERARIVVAEISNRIVDWASGPMARLTGDSLADPRLDLRLGDVAGAIEKAGSGEGYDAILLDVDNGPDGLVRAKNDRLYTRTGLAKAREALKPGGILAIWSAAPDPAFTRRLKQANFEVEAREVRARPNNKGPRHTIWFARKRG